MIRPLLLTAFILAIHPFALFAQDGAAAPEGFVAVMKMDMMILPGSQEYLESTISAAENDGARLLVLILDTPGGMLPTTQQMIQRIFKSTVPVVVYVAPTGATATSAGVFITMAGHVAAMAPGTSIGAAHPVAGDGKDIEGDMRQKAENMTIAMVRSISEQRGRNVSWAEKAVKESSSITEKEALKLSVVEIVAGNIDQLLKQLEGKKIKLGSEEVTLEDYSSLPRREYEATFKQKTLNILANPNVLALLWMVATTGLAIELYNPGAILPGMVGLICLVLALAMSQVIPVTVGGVLLLVLGILLIGLEVFVPSGILAVGGIISMVLGSIYLIDAAEAPGLSVSYPFIATSAIILGSIVLYIVYSLIQSARRKELTGSEGMVGMEAQALKNFSGKGKVFVNGEVWNAELTAGLAQKGELLDVVGVKGLMLDVRKKSGA
ncbi:MAG: nodulation protein NfeD [Deltaproteobacteria bacterium]|nr:nodulation protein NfeD [Deltaproteobacteria bacterium]